jgi:UDP-glucose 4-epimerase
MKVLITGAAGFIGSHLADSLLEAGVEVFGIDDLSNGLSSNLPGDFSLHVGSITEAKLVDRLVAEADCVVHLAARGSVPRSVESPDETFASNVEGTRVVLDAVRRKKTALVFASSSSVYGANTSLPKTEESWISPMSPYGASKAAGEALVTGYAHSYGFPFQVFRFFNVYGPRQRHDHPYAAVIPKFIHAIAAGETLRIYGDGAQIRDFTYVADLCRIVKSVVLDNRYSGRTMNLAFGSPRTVNDVITSLRELMPTSFEVNFAPPRDGEVRNSYSAPERLLEEFPDVTPTDWMTGLKACVDDIGQA